MRKYIVVDELYPFYRLEGHSYYYADTKVEIPDELSERVKNANEEFFECQKILEGLEDERRKLVKD